MARSLSLAAYLAYARRATQAAPQPAHPRPEGQLIWAHAVDAARADALVGLAERLISQRSGLHVLLTTAPDNTPANQGGQSVIWQQLPADTIAASDAFLGHWTPDLCVWTGGDLQPALLSRADAKGVPLYLIDADEKLLTRTSWRWFPDLPRSLLKRFSSIMANSKSTAQFLHRAGVGDVEITVTGPFVEGAIALPHNESDREELAGLLRGRPVWLAAMLQPGEIPAVLRAHRAACRLSHRAMLIIVPDAAAPADSFRDALDSQEWRYATWSEGELPEETTQILLADTTGEMGLWYRVAPITFMGNSLVEGGSGCDPNEPAAHGSAILYGPHVARYKNSYARYAEFGGARIVRDADTLAGALQRLLPPDKTASMAHAAWDVASRGADVTDQIADLIHEKLDLLEIR